MRRLLCDLDSEGYRSQTYGLLDSRTNFPILTPISLLVWIESELHRSRLVGGAFSAYAGSWKEGMSHQVQITWLDFCDSNIPPKPNRAEVYSFAKHVLLMLEVQSREYRIKSELHRSWVKCGCRDGNDIYRCIENIDILGSIYRKYPYTVFNISIYLYILIFGYNWQSHSNNTGWQPPIYRVYTRDAENR